MMKYAWVVLITVFVMGCKQGVETSSSLVIEAVSPTENDVAIKSDRLVPVYDYNGLNERYLTVDNDTTYIINFWATWCKPCVKELPAFEQLHHRYAAQPVKVILVSLDFPDKLEKSVIPFLDEKQIASSVVLLDDADANAWIPAISEVWSGAIPATLFITKEKRKFYERSFTYEELDTELKRIR